MKKILLSCLCLYAIGINAQTTIFEDGFEAYTTFAITGVGAWTLIDVDLKNTYTFDGQPAYLNAGVAKSFQVFNPASVDPPLVSGPTSNWTARTGVKNMVCIAASTPLPAVNNDWLISPQITLGSTGNVVSFWAKSCDTEYGLERFKVGISAGNTTSNVTLLSTGNYVITPANITYVLYTYNVPASFNGQAVYFSINCVSNDQFGFAVDDFKVTTTGLSTSDFSKNNFKIYPNPSSDIVSVSSNNNSTIETIEVTDVNGRIVKNVVANNTFSVKELTSGVYFLKITTTEGVGTTKFVKQ